MTNKAKILITGATGFTGSRFIEKYLGDYDFLGIKRKKSKVPEFLPIQFIDDEDISEQMLLSFSPDILINLAAHSSFNCSISEINELIESNIKMPSIVTEFFIKSGGKKVLNIGSYWQHYENKPYRPNSFYAATKQAYEDILDYYVVEHSAEIITLKLFDTYGANDPRPKILKIVHQAAISNTSLDLTSGKQLIYPTHIDDIVVGINSALKLFLKGHQKYLLRPNKPVTLKEMVEMYLKVNNLKAELNWGKREHSKRDFFSEVDVFPVLPGWMAKKELAKGLKDLY